MLERIEQHSQITIEAFISQLFLSVLDKFIPGNNKVNKYTRYFIRTYLSIIFPILKRKLSIIGNAPIQLSAELYKIMIQEMDILNTRLYQELEYHVTDIPKCVVLKGIEKREQIKHITNEVNKFTKNLKKLIKPIDWSNKTKLEIAGSLYSDAIQYSSMASNLIQDVIPFMEPSGFYLSISIENNMNYLREHYGQRDWACGDIGPDVLNVLDSTFTNLKSRIPSTIKFHKNRLKGRVHDVGMDFMEHVVVSVVLMIIIAKFLSMIGGYLWNPFDNEIQRSGQSMALVPYSSNRRRSMSRFR